MPKPDLAALAEVAMAKLLAGVPLKLPEAAAVLGVAVKTVEGWRYRQARGGRVPPLAFRRHGGALRVTAESVAAVLRAPADSKLRPRLVRAR